MNMRFASLAACVAFFPLGAGCASSAPRSAEPDPRVLELEKRVTLLEEASARLNGVATQMAKLADTLSKRATARNEELSATTAPRNLERRGPRAKNNDEELELKLAEIDDRLLEIERKVTTRIAGGGGRAAPVPRRARPPGPDPTAVYAIPVAGSPYVGPRYAKVTIVKAFEFA